MVSKFEYDVPRIIARVNNPKNAWLFNSGMGVDAKINQADIIGHMIADEMNYQSIMTLMKLSKGDFQSCEFELIINHDMPANKFLKFLYQTMLS